MKEIRVQQGKSSKLYEFYPDDMNHFVFDETWESTWCISENVTNEIVLKGFLKKSPIKYNDDALIDGTNPDISNLNFDFDFEGTNNDLLFMSPSEVTSSSVTAAGYNLTINNEFLVAVNKCSEDYDPENPDPDANKPKPFNGKIKLTVREKGKNRYKKYRKFELTIVDGKVVGSIFLGGTVKKEAGTSLLFQLTPENTLELDNKEYSISIHVNKKLDDNLVFSDKIWEGKLYAELKCQEDYECKRFCPEDDLTYYPRLDAHK